MILLSITSLSYSLGIQPFSTKAQNMLEIMNEGVLISVAYCIIAYSDYIGNPVFKYKVGWASGSTIFVQYDN